VHGTGIGPILRKARLIRGKSIEEASRETHIRTDYLQALERETFESLLGDVYVRGFLRSYSTYLGLNADRVLTTYNRHFGPPRPMLPEPLPGPVRSQRTIHPHLPPVVRHHPSWSFLIGVALLALAAFAAAGLLRSRTTAASGTVPPAVPQALPAAASSVSVAIRADTDVHVRIRADGEVVFDARLRAGEGRSFEGTTTIAVMIDHGGAARLTVNGHDIGTPGVPTLVYRATFRPNSFRSSPSPSSR
jgi:helix-turn-helix protein/uncharacterized protein DUF4115